MGLAGAQLVHSNSILYLFSGYSHQTEKAIEHFLGLCTLDLLKEDSQWVESPIQNSLKNYTHGGSCVFNNKIFYFFGSFFNKTGLTYSDKIYRLKLDDIEKGWDEVDFKCPEGIVCARDSFGITCNDENVTIIGGRTTSGSTNSYLTINIRDFIVETFKKQTSHPGPRAFASLTQSSTKILLFGGIIKDTIYNEIWEYEFIGSNKLGIWTSLTILGSSPEPRYGHASVAQGVFTIFVGGTTYNNRILSDIWLLNTVSYTWTELLPSETSDYKIPTLTRTCAMLDLPKLYFIGGRGNSGSNFDLWEYDLSTKNLILLRKTASSDIGTFGHACQLIKRDGKMLIYTVYGLKNTLNDLYCGIREIDITDVNNIIVKVVKESPIDMLCRGNFGYAFDGRYMTIIGGEIYPDFTMKDIWLIELQDEYLEMFIVDAYTKNDMFLYETLSGSSIISFSEFILVFSGYYDGSFSINSDLSSSLYALKISGSDYCSAGFYRINNECQPCQIGTYNQYYNGICQLCPLGTTNNLTAASHISQCIPCQQGTYFNLDSNSCINCPEGFICPIGSHEPLDPSIVKKVQKSQPPIFIKPSAKFPLIILGSSLGGILLLYLALYFSSLLLKILLSALDIFKSDHIIKSKHRNFNEEKIRISLIGGFFTGLAIIIIIFNYAYLIMNYTFENENEIRSLIPSSSLLKEHDYNNNHLTLEIYMYSYRGNCSHPSILTSDTFEVSYFGINEEIAGKSSILCTHVINVDFDTLFIAEASLELSFLGYTSDIALSVYGDSANPGGKSLFTQVLNSSDGGVFIGNDPSLFTVNLIPDYYNYRGFLGFSNDKLGLRLGVFDSPASGSFKSIENIYFSTGFKVRTKFILSEFGVTTYRFQQISIISFVIMVISSSPGFVSYFRLFLIVFEKIYFRFRKQQSKNDKAGRATIQIFDEEKKDENSFGKIDNKI